MTYRLYGEKGIYMYDINKVVGNQTIAVIAYNNYASACLEEYAGDENRIVFYDSDYKFITDWIIESPIDCAEKIKLVIDGISDTNQTAISTIKFFSEIIPERKNYEIGLFSNWLDIQEKYSEEYYNRIHSHVFIYNG